MPRARFAARTALALSLALALGCSPPTTNTDAGDAGGDASAEAGDDAMTGGPDDGVVRPRAEDCDPLDEAACSLPWPSNRYLQPDTTRPTGYALRFGPTSLPINDNGATVSPTPWERLDGYGLGTPIMTVFPNLDASSLPHEDQIDRSLAADASILLFEVNGTTLTRVPYYAELNLQDPNPATKVLFVRPAVLLKENTRYVVAFRNLRNTMGQPIAASRAFTALRDRTAMSDPALAPRVARFEQVFTLLEGAMVPRASLTLAWDFHTASSDALHGTLLRMRDTALQMMPTGCELVVNEVKEFTRTMDSSGREVNEHIALEINGSIRSPEFLRTARLGSVAGIEFNRDAMGRVAPNGTRLTPFWIRIPWSAMDGTPHDLLQYGHGLLGDGSEARSGWLGELANRERLIVFASSLTGMSTGEYFNALAAVENFANFRGIADGLHQGLMEWVLFARAMKMRFATMPQVASRNIRSTGTVWYSGNSQGGIFGATYMAIARDVERGHLGVGGINYSTLLHRSVDFVPFLRTLRANYGSRLDEAIGLGAIQLLWDQTDPVSYFRHITAQPFPGNMPHYVFVTPARGDHQVAVFTNEIAARSDIGLVTMAPYDDVRMPFGITPVPYPQRNTSAYILFHFGNPWQRRGNQVTDDMMRDPHEAVRRDRRHNDMMLHFFRTGEIVDRCGMTGC